MAERKAEPGAGDVSITLGGKQMVMRPSLEACMTITKLAGNSLSVAMARIIERMDFEFIVDVVAVGIGETSPHLKKQVAEAVYQQGVISIAAECILFVRTIMNGGKPPVDDDIERSLEHIDALSRSLPDDLREQAAPLEDLRRALVAKLEEAGTEAEDPLPAT
jgi:hypothetical protein